MTEKETYLKQKGCRVRVKSEYGKVNYVRMKPPEYNSIEVVSVILDSRSNDPNYSGTIFSVEDVVPTKEKYNA